MGRGISISVAVAVAIAGVSSASGAAPERVRPPQVKTPCDPADGPGGGYCGDGALAGAARLSSPRDVSAFPNGDVLIADGQNGVIRRVEAGTDIISTAAGLGIVGDRPPRTPTSVGEVALIDPRGVAALPDGSFAIVDAGLRAVLLVTPTGLVSTLLDSRRLQLPVDVAALDAHTLAVVDTGRRAKAGRIVKVDVHSRRTRTLVRGLDRPWQVAPDATGGLVISQRRSHGPANVVRRAPDGTRTILAGAGAPGVPGTLRFDRISGVFPRTDGSLLVTDRHTVSAISGAGAIPLAGSYRPTAGGEPRYAANIYVGQGEGMTQSGNEILIADAGTNQVHRVAVDGSAPTTEIGIGPGAAPGATALVGGFARTTEIGIGPVAAAGATALRHAKRKLLAKHKHKRTSQKTPGITVCDPGKPPMAALYKVNSFKRGRLLVTFGGKGGKFQVTIRKSHVDEREIKRAPADGRLRTYKIVPGVRGGGWHARLRWQAKCRDAGIAFTFG
ncbi:MAG: hypothetical protein QOI48_2433 [Solirubrobacteraceae bacterium]|jgi:hypothetical protein|nr:hypothetical protein [Solirubrobacteraceae bacterium]